MDNIKLIITGVVSILVSSGIIAGIMHHYSDKRMRTYEVKLQKYSALIEELGKLASNIPDYNKLFPLLNSALFFASDEVVGEILKFNKAFRMAQEGSQSNNVTLIPEREIRSLVMAIRNEFYLKSDAIQKEGLWFFIVKNRTTVP